MVSQVQPQGEAKEKVRKTKFIILTGSRDRRHAIRVTWKATRVVRRQKAGAGQSEGLILYWGFCGKSKPGQSRDFELASLSNLGGL